MKLNPRTIIAATLGLAFACAEDDSLSVAEQNATYTAAVDQAGGADLGGVPDDSAMPGERDAPPNDREGDVHRDCSVEGAHQRVLENADADGDGTLSDEERAAMEAPFGEGGPRGHGPRGERGPRGPMSWRRLAWIYDADGSGDLDEAERAVLEADLEARGANIEARLLADFDADGDGALGDAELEAAREAHRAEMEARRAAELAAYDTDGDGRLNREERRAAHEARRAALTAEHDADGSGELDDTEKAALREHLRAIVRGEVEPA
jgi:hypothetical protein